MTLFEKLSHVYSLLNLYGFDFELLMPSLLRPCSGYVVVVRTHDVYSLLLCPRPVTRRTKTAKNKKADITFAAHCHNVNVLLSNISLFDFCCFSSAS